MLFQHQQLTILNLSNSNKLFINNNKFNNNNYHANKLKFKILNSKSLSSNNNYPLKKQVKNKNLYKIINNNINNNNNKMLFSINNNIKFNIK